MPRAYTDRTTCAAQRRGAALIAAHAAGSAHPERYDEK